MNTSELLAIIEKLSIDPIWECYTRPALEYRWQEFIMDATGIVYCDIDDMHGLNAQYTHAGTDARIKQVIHAIRHEDIVASRWLNGDELVFILKSGDSKQFCERIRALFSTHGIRATFAHSKTLTTDAASTVNPLDNRVQESKNNGTRGVIIS
jgi:GGDEF domain-containing protein